MEVVSQKQRFRKHISKRSQTRSANDSPIKEQPHYYDKKSCSLHLIQQQGELRDNIIEQLHSLDLAPFGMLTVRPARNLGLHLIRDLALAINIALEKRYNPRYKKHWGSPHLTFYERDSNAKGNPTWHYHIHILFCKLPVDKVLNKKKLTYPVEQAVKAIFNKDRISKNMLTSSNIHKLMIEYGIRHPFDPEGYGSYYKMLETIQQEHCLEWSLSDQEKCFDGLFGWRGLVSYVTKDIFTTDQMMDHIDPKTMKRLKMKLKSIDSSNTSRDLSFAIDI